MSSLDLATLVNWAESYRHRQAVDSNLWAWHCDTTAWKAPLYLFT